jgi:hypothetical protein
MANHKPKSRKLQQRAFSHQRQICHSGPGRRQNPGELIAFQQPTKSKKRNDNCKLSFLRMAIPSMHGFVAISEDNLGLDESYVHS